MRDYSMRLQATLVDEPPPLEGTEESIEEEPLPDPDEEPEEDEDVEGDDLWEDEWPKL